MSPFSCRPLAGRARIAAVALAVVAAPLAVASAAAPHAAAAACPWGDSSAPIPQRVGQLLSSMDMPGNDGFYGTALSSAVSSGSVPKATLDSLTSQVLTQMFAFGLFDKAPPGRR